ncbi:GNAT family N-acetyltransferase [Chondrinema litorale]|uniref:GNAT family N-acetyltransferase n=1 Tax=Chondrinema litorale TaxID=2994555 RepID=UPI00254320BF|nr:GNAT family protein [Chondrinema litorale]UZR98223.1 GNAT family protein [Chondrinema litorale]
MELKPITTQEDSSKSIFNSPDCQQLLEAYQNFYPTIGYNPPWIGYFIFDQETVVGSCGFTGKPMDGKVELAYWTFKAHENKGIASFACKELIKIAKQTDNNLIITAKTAPEENASTHILKKHGFTFSGIVQDHEIGDAWLWQLQPEN